MPRFGWTRLAYLLFVLTVLAVLTWPGSPGAETRSLAAEFPQGTTSTGARPSDAAKPPETTEMARRIEDATSSLVDLSGDEGAPKARSPGPEAAPAEAPDRETVPPVFYRPPATGRSSGNVPAAESGPVCGDLGRFPESRRVVFPLEERYFYSYEDTWGAPRTQGGHEGTDLMAPTGAPEYAVTDGTVVPVAGSNENGWNTLGGYAVMVRADYSVGPVKAGDLFYYAHLDGRSPLKVGTRVRAGQVIGHAGDTGQGPEVTRGLFPAHLHLGWYDGTGARSGADSGAMNPYPLLEWIKANGGAVTGGSSARYCEAPSPPTPVPSTGEKDWPAPDAPGVRPDLDTGSNDPKPSPVVRNDARGHAQILTAKRADPAKRPAPVPRDRAARKKDPRDAPVKDAPVKVPETERPRTPKPSTPGTQEPMAPEPQATKPPKPEAQESEPPRREPPRGETPKPPASGGDAPPIDERPSSGLVEEDPDALTARPDLQDLLEDLIPDLDREPTATDKRDRPGKDERDEKHKKERAKERAKRDREEKPAANEPERHPNSPAGHEPSEDEPSPPDPKTDDPDGADEPEPETTEPLPETTVAQETTSG